MAGKIERCDAGCNAKRLAHGIDINAGPGVLGVLALQQMRYAGCKFAHFDAALNIAMAVGNGLAVFCRQHLGKLFLFGIHQVDEFGHDARTPLRICCRPCRLGSPGIGNSRLQLGFTGQSNFCLNFAGVGVKYVSKPPGCARNQFAANEVPDFLDHTVLHTHPLPADGSLECVVPIRAKPRALFTQMEAFDGTKSVHSARRKVKRDVGHRASFATTPMDRFGPPKAGFLSTLDDVTASLWSTRPRRKPRLASEHRKPVKRFYLSEKCSSQPVRLWQASVCLWSPGMAATISTSRFVAMQQFRLCNAAMQYYLCVRRPSF